MFNSIIYKIEAFILAITLFFVGIAYGDEPIAINFDCEFSSYEVSPGGYLSAKIDCENIGRPFQGDVIHDHEANVSFYKIKDGERISVPMLVFSDCAEASPVLVKRSEKFTCLESMQFDLDAEPGTYSASVTVYGCEKIYEDILTIK